MHDYNVHEALYLNFENQGPWVLGSGPKVRPRWLYGENVFKPSKGDKSMQGYEDEAL